MGTSTLFEENPRWALENIYDAIYVTTFYMYFGLQWIHNAYPNYIMADVDSDGYGSSRTYNSALDISTSNDPLMGLADTISSHLPELVDSDGNLIPGTDTIIDNWLAGY